MPEFWIYRGSEYVSEFEYVTVLDIPSSKYARVAQGFEYAWIIPGYAWLCLNVYKSVWMAFVLHLPTVVAEGIWFCLLF